MDKKATEQVLWTVPDTAVNPASIEVGNCVQPDETYKTLLLRLLNERLRPFDRQVKEPDEKEFVSQTSRPYSNGKKATHVKAFRGSKDGKYCRLSFQVFDQSFQAMLVSVLFSIH